MTTDIFILGVSMSNHDRAACLLRNGKIVTAIAEERLDRRKRSDGFYAANSRNIVLPPMAAIRYVLDEGGIGLDDLSLIVCGRSIQSCRETLLAYLPVPEHRVVEPPLPGHHFAHAYSAYGTAPFKQCAVLVIDEQGHHLQDGTFEKCSWFEGSTGELVTLRQFMGNPNDLSIGMFYNAFAALVGLWEARSPAAGKLMGLAPYGKHHPEWPELIYLDPIEGNTQIPLTEIDQFFATAGVAVRTEWHGTNLTRLDDLLLKYIPVSWKSELGADLACKAQDELERGVLHIASCLRHQANIDKLAYAGGVALNCTANARLKEAGWSDVYIQPAATDDGNAIGLAMYGWIEVLGNARKPVKLFSPFTGRHYKQDLTAKALDTFGLADIAKRVVPGYDAASRLAQGQVICWFQGKSEWGPRALGSRSIAANPMLPGIKDRVNAQIKYREAFRPFAISGIMPHLSELLDVSNVPTALASYMLAVAKAHDPRLAEVAHIDSTVRYQVVDARLQPEWYELINEFGKQTGLFVVFNTSFNTLGEPLVETPEDAVRQFLLCNADALIIQDRLVARADIPDDVFDAARIKAFSMTSINPLTTALSLDSSGYTAAALNVLEQCQYTAEKAAHDGAEAVRQFHELKRRAALQQGNYWEAAFHAEKILGLSGLPTEAALAANLLASHPLASEQEKSVGRYLSVIAPHGGALNFIKKVVERRQSIKE